MIHCAAIRVYHLCISTVESRSKALRTLKEFSPIPASRETYEILRRVLDRCIRFLKPETRTSRPRNRAICSNSVDPAASTATGPASSGRTGQWRPLKLFAGILRRQRIERRHSRQEERIVTGIASTVSHFGRAIRDVSRADCEEECSEAIYPLNSSINAPETRPRHRVREADEPRRL